jgi:hypothetical protein
MLNVVTGKLGSGKSLYSIAEAWKYYKDGRRIVTNFPIDFSTRAHTKKSLKNSIQVLPDLPTPQDLHGLGVGGSDEHNSGLLIIDEAARWLNSRDWGDKNRKEVIDWLLHSRKLGWDVMLIVQTHEMLDKQVRSGLMEYHTVCRRLDRVRVMGIRLPHIHLATTYYGLKTESSNSPPKADKLWYRPKEWGIYYDTRSLFKTSNVTYSMLSRWHLIERYKKHYPPVFYALLLPKALFLLGLYLCSTFSKPTKLYLKSRGLPYVKI